LIGYASQHKEQVREAGHRIQKYVRRTPCLTTDLDPDLRLKPECFQVTGSFKPRGAFNAVLSQMAREPRPAGVIAVSSGNHAQAVALAARTVGIPALILIPEDANPAKVAATRALGAEVIQEGITFANREERLQEVMAERGYSLVHPFDDWDVIHGQGSAGPTLITPRNIIRNAIRQASTGQRRHSTTGSTEPAAMIQITIAGRTRLSIRYSPAAKPSPINGSAAIGAAYRQIRRLGAGRGASRATRSERSGPVAVRLAAGRIISTRAGYGGIAVPS